MPTAPRRRPRVDRRFTVGTEALEPRLVLSAVVAVQGKSLVVTGSADPDLIVISAGRAADTVRVTVDGRFQGTFGPVERLEIAAGGGNDRVQVGPGVRLPAKIDGGAGDDRLRGGSGADIIRGGDGDDVLFGSSGRDALDGDQGRNRLLVSQSMGTLWVGASASGESLRLLRQAYTLRPLNSARGPISGPIIVGAADLDDASTVAKLRAAYGAGDTVAIAGGSTADAARLRTLLGHEGSADPASGAPAGALVAYRKAQRDDGQNHFISTILMPRADAAIAPGRARQGRRQADAADIERLSVTFSGTPVVPEKGAGDPPSQPNLLDLATSYEKNTIASDAAGDQVQGTSFTYGVRSFLNQVDYYYVRQEVDVVLGGFLPPPARIEPTPVPISLSVAVGSVLENLTPTLFSTSPGTTQETTTETIGVSFSIGGSAGFNAAQGPNASGSVGLSISYSKTTTIPPVVITNQQDLTTGQPLWNYAFNTTTNQLEPGASYTFLDQYIWQVPFSAYAAGQTSVSFSEAFTQTIAFQTTVFGPYTIRTVSPAVTSTIPLPFGTVFALQKPVVTSVSPSSINVGGQFTITGTGFYPSLVTSVLIDGTPLASSQYTVVSDTQITVIAPDSPGIFPQTVAVQTTQGISNANQTITITPNV